MIELPMNQTAGLFILISSILSLAPAREFTSADGKTIEGEVISIRNDQVVLQIGTKQYTLPTTRFSEADQSYFDEWKIAEAKNIIPKLDVDVSTGKSNRLDTADEFDDRKGSFQFSVKIQNNERNYDIEGATARLVVIGEHCEERKKYAIMQTTDFQLSVKEGDTFSWQGDTVSYKFDDSEPSRWGHQYYGYVLQISNASGKIIFTKTLPKKFEGDEAKILALKRSTGFDDQMKNLGNASIYFE
ncbi:MAG: hypothetical protein P1U68_12590 [Verrucomicrobiales bacterium]|nr:hypothetical protein [Verrucomicrobiales bacterium]